jgi:hypothetical protein
MARTPARTFALFHIVPLLTVLGGLAWQPMAEAKEPKIEFDMTVSAGAQACLPDATAHVVVKSKPAAETMDVKVSGLPPHTAFDLFVIQVPKAPFGVSWHEGDLETNARGKGHAKFIGRFNAGTFIVGPGSAPAPVVHAGPFPDASLNPSFNPLHTYHLGLWFDSPTGAMAAGCAATVTPFNATHGAGMQVLNTATFADDQGPLRQLAP